MELTVSSFSYHYCLGQTNNNGKNINFHATKTKAQISSDLLAGRRNKLILQILYSWKIRSDFPNDHKCSVNLQICLLKSMDGMYDHFILVWNHQQYISIEPKLGDDCQSNGLSLCQPSRFPLSQGTLFENSQQIIYHFKTIEYQSSALSCVMSALPS